MLVFGSANVHEAVQDYSSVAFHERWLLRFYDLYLKGKATGWDRAPGVRWFVGGSGALREAEDWPPPAVETRALYLQPTGDASVTSLNGCVAAIAAGRRALN